MAASSNGHAHRRRQPGYRAPIVMLVIGLIIGTLAALAWRLLVPPSVPMADYVVLVSGAYDRERLPMNAVERLAAVGVHDPAGTVATIARAYRQNYPDRQREIQNLEQLAAALNQQGSLVAAGKTGEGTDWWKWLVLPVVLAGAIGIAVRRRRRSVPLRSLPRVAAPEIPQAELLGGLRAKESFAELEEGTRRPAPGDEGGLRTAPRRSKITRSSSPAVGRRRELVLRPFVCTYHAGDEPFEDVHPILHEDGDVLIGAGGLTAAAKLEGSGPARYYALTAWVHDYLSGEPMCAVGLLSPWASGRKRLALYDPALTRATLQRTEKGLTANMETKNLSVTVEVTDVDYGTARDVPANSYFTILSVKFSVTIKG